MKIVAGMKVKVHNRHHALYGEVLGVTNEGKLLVASRSDFKTHPVSSFHLFRQFDEVDFIQAGTLQYSFTNTLADIPKKPRASKHNHKRLLENLLKYQQKHLLENQQHMDAIHCGKTARIINNLQQKLNKK